MCQKKFPNPNVQGPKFSSFHRIHFTEQGKSKKKYFLQKKKVQSYNLWNVGKVIIADKVNDLKNINTLPQLKTYGIQAKNTF